MTKTNTMKSLNEFSKKVALIALLIAAPTAAMADDWAGVNSEADLAAFNTDLYATYNYVKEVTKVAVADADNQDIKKAVKAAKIQKIAKR